MRSKLILGRVCTFVIVNLMVGVVWADPRPPLPPIPALFNAQFDRPNDTEGAFAAEGVQWVESWSGSALQLDSGFIGWAGTSRMFLRQRIVSPTQGTVRFWFRPPAATPLAESTLLECATWAGGRAYPWFSIKTSTAGIGVVAGGQIIMGAPTDWDPSAWHFIVFTYSATNGSALYLDGEPVAQGPSLAPPSIPTGANFGICFGSADGSSPAQGTYDELTTENYVQSADQVAHHYSWTAPIAALGPITPAEIAARAEMRAEALAVRQQQLRMQALRPMPMDDPQPIDCTSGPLHLTNFVQVASNVFQMTIAGGAPNTSYDVFRTISLNGPYLTNSQWGWVGRGLQCDTITDTNAIMDKGFYVAAVTNDSNGNGYSDAYEALVKTNTTVTISFPTNGATFAAPTNITVTATINNYAANSPVTIYVNQQALSTQVGYSGTVQCSVNWNADCPGNYDIFATVFDGVFTATSSVAHVTVTLPELASLKCWLKADSLSLSNRATVTNWLDSSGSGNNATTPLASAPMLLTNQVNGLPAIAFDGTNDYLTLPNCLSGATVVEAFVVLRPANATLSGPLWMFSTLSQYTSYNTNGINDSFGRQDVLSFATSIPALSSFHVYNVSASSNLWRACVNGATFVSTDDPGFGFNTAPTLGRCMTGSTWSYGKPTIAEILIFTKALTDLERTAVGRYLTAKYALAISPASAITNLRCDAPTPSDIRLTWNAVSNATAFCISRAIGSQPPTILATVPTNTLTYTDPISSSEAIIYQVATLSYAGSGNATLSTPIVTPTSPSAGSAFWVNTAISMPMSQQGGNPLNRIEVYRDTRLISTQNAPGPMGLPNYGITLSSDTPTRWDISIKAIDTSGNYRWSPTRTVFAVESPDSAGDGVPDSQDAFPWDPLRWQAPTGNPGDTNAPIITITEP